MFELIRDSVLRELSVDNIYERFLKLDIMKKVVLTEVQFEHIENFKLTENFLITEKNEKFNDKFLK